MIAEVVDQDNHPVDARLHRTDAGIQGANSGGLSVPFFQ